MIMNSCTSRLLSACARPLITFIIGTGRGRVGAGGVWRPAVLEVAGRDDFNCVGGVGDCYGQDPSPAAGERGGGGGLGGCYLIGVFSVGKFAATQPFQPPRRAAVFLTP